MILICGAEEFPLRTFVRLRLTTSRRWPDRLQRADRIFLNLAIIYRVASETCDLGVRRCDALSIVITNFGIRSSEYRGGVCCIV